MDEEKIVTGEPELIADENAPDVQTPEGEASVEIGGRVDTPLEENISDKLKRAGERISRASADAEQLRRKREKEAPGSEFDEEKQRQAERARIEKELSMIENAAEHRRAAMEYAEGYRARLREEKENNPAIKKREEQRQRQISEQNDARAKEIADSIEREREEAEERSRRRDSVLSRAVGAVESANESVIAREARIQESCATEVTEPAFVPNIQSEAVSEPAAEEIDYTINIESNASERDLLVMDGVTVASIPTGAYAAPASSKEPTPKEQITEPEVFYDYSEDEPKSAVKPKATEGVSWENQPIRQRNVSAENQNAPQASVTESDYFTDEGFVEYGEVEKTAERAGRAYEEYSSMVGGVDAPGGDFDFDRWVRRTPQKDRLDEERELLLHADGAPKVEFEVREKDGEIDITPKYPDPTTEPPSAKEKKRREKEARENEEKALLEFERLSRVSVEKKTEKSTGKKNENRDERAMREYESRMDERAEEQRRKSELEAAARSKKQAEADARQQAEIEAQLEAEREAKRAEAAEMPAPVSRKTQPKPKKKPKSTFDKSPLVATKKRQIKNDMLFIEHRVYDEIRSMQLDAKKNEFSFVSRVDSQSAKKEKQKIDRSLLDAKERLKLAKKFEAKDNDRYYELVVADISKVKISRRSDRDEVGKYREQLVELLRRRDKLNLELIGLYGISTDGKDKSKNAQGRFNAELNGRRAAYKKQIPKMKRLDKYRVGFDDKKKLCSLMDERTEMMARLACINYIFKKEKPKKDAKRELSRERKKIKRGLAVNERDYNRLEDRILRRASRNNSSKNAMIIGWVVILLLAAAGVGVFLCWDLIWPHIQGFIQSIKDSMNK